MASKAQGPLPGYEAARLARRLLIFGVLIAIVFRMLGSAVGHFADSMYVTPPQSTMAIAIVKPTMGTPLLSSLHVAQAMAEAEGVDELVVVLVRYRTKPLPLFPWRAGGQLVKENRENLVLRHIDDGWRYLGEQRDLSSEESSLIRDFERGDGVNASTKRCRDRVRPSGTPAIILQPIGWLLIFAAPTGLIACGALMARWIPRAQALEQGAS